METEKGKLSYVIGRQVGGDFKNQGLELDLALLFDGIGSVYEGKQSKISQSETLEVLKNFQAELQKKKFDEESKKSKENQEQAKVFFESNKTQSDVVSTDTGLQYRVIKGGTGVSPEETDTVKTHYEGSLLCGEVFDSSYKRGEPVSFPVNGVIKGWQEALSLMKEGDEWELFIPSQLAYGSVGSPPAIGPDAALRFRVELIKVNPDS